MTIIKHSIALFILFLLIISCQQVNSENKVNIKEKTDTVKDINVTEYEYFDDSATNYKWKTYYSNGQLRELGEQDNIAGCGTAIGTHFFYDSTGILMKKVEYHNWMFDSDEGCHSSLIQDSKVTEYFSHGEIQAIKYFQSGYETEEYKVGEWKFYDKNGKLINSETFNVKWKK